MRKMSKAFKAEEYDRVKANLSVHETALHLMFNGVPDLDLSSKNVPGWKKAFGIHHLIAYGIGRADGGIAVRVWNPLGFDRQSKTVDVYLIDGLRSWLSDAAFKEYSDESLIYRILVERFLAQVNAKLEPERNRA